MLKALFERHIEGKHVSFHRHVITPEEREEIEKDKQLPYYSTAFVQGAPSLKCINMLNSIRKPRCSDLAGFHIHKWISNEPDVIADIAEGDLASEIDLEKRDLPATKTLRVLWAATDDKFSFRQSLQLDGFEANSISLRPIRLLINLCNQVQVVDTKGLAGGTGLG